MKLRNKKTGEIIKPYYVELRIWHDHETPEDITVNSLAELNEEWEDYKPAEPLIKDEKIRKAVRVWADALKLSNCRYDAYWKAFRFCDLTISFLCDFDLEDGRIYDITELCGEGEE